MDKVSVIIITKNEAENIASCIASARLVSNDIVVVDSGSKDATVDLAQKAGAKTISISWQGFGAARNTAAEHVHNDWVIAIDADERITSELADHINAMVLTDPFMIYGFKRQNYFLGKKIHFGEWGRDVVYRMYNRHHVSWDLSPVHEQLAGANTIKEKINKPIDHYPVVRDEQNTEKTFRYATLNAKKFFEQGKKASFVKRFLSPVFNFIKCYFFLLGFLDGRQGFNIAKVTSYYVWLKYKLLHEMYLKKGREVKG